MSRTASPAPSRPGIPHAGEVRTPSGAAPFAQPPTPVSRETEYISGRLESLINQFGNRLSTTDSHIISLLGAIPNTASPVDAPEPGSAFSRITAQLTTLQRQADWLDAVGERILLI